MNILLDSNIILRLADRTCAAHAVAAASISALRAQGNSLVTIPQCFYEFWVAATRPIANNGLDFSPAECLRQVAILKASFPMFDDKPALFTEWESVVSDAACHGKVAHDARYVAAMRTHGLTHLLTFNGGDFSRFTGISILDPNLVAGSAPPNKGP